MPKKLAGYKFSYKQAKWFYFKQRSQKSDPLNLQSHVPKANLPETKNSNLKFLKKTCDLERYAKIRFKILEKTSLKNFQRPDSP
jgi:hypothetical protein